MPFLGGHGYPCFVFLDPCFVFLVMSPLGFKARAGSALFAFLRISHIDLNINSSIIARWLRYEFYFYQ